MNSVYADKLKYDMLTVRVLAEHDRYYFTRNTKMDLSIALEKTVNLQKFLQNKVDEENAENDYENKCAICWESFVNKSIVKTSCNHTFCLNCIEQNKKQNKNTGKLCTICRKNIYK